ncbi:hypothetical protein CP532_5569 [Ophiocordyceps camponoti-leonardi (nom. inval.)]|nr:hypothetical protein CP532_5569 [Ophiocordyceps camponoti-leonardi (nom. inval.)]
MTFDEPPHAAVYPRCGICGFRFLPPDTFFALVGRDATDCWSSTFTVNGSFRITSSGGFEIPYDENLEYCRDPDCSYCLSAPDSCTVHVLCLKLFIRQPDFKKEADPKEITDKLRRLWVAATWTSPWHGAIAPDVEPYVHYRSDRDLRGMLDHLPQIMSLIPELSSMIWEFCASSSLWLYSAVLDLYDELSVSKLRRQPSIPLIKIKSWARSHQPEYNDNTTTPGSDFLRLTIDSRGLRRIERLKERPSRNNSRSDFKAFIVEAADCFPDVCLEFQLTLAQYFREAVV